MKTSRILALSVIGLLAFSATICTPSNLNRRSVTRSPVSVPAATVRRGRWSTSTDCATNYVRSRYVRDQIRKDREAPKLRFVTNSINQSYDHN